MLVAAALLVTHQWDEHLAWMKDHWQPGQHIANIGPTGEGKTTYSVGLLGIRRYVLALDPKGKDKTLSASGFTRVESIPPLGGFPLTPGWWQAKGYRLTKDGRAWEDIWRGIDEGRDARVVVGGAARSREQVAALRQLMGDAVEYCRYCTNWTLYIDEFELAASQQMYRLGGPVSEMLATARDAGISVFVSFQAPAWVPSHATRQATYGVMYSTGDRDMIEKVARAFGRDKRQLAEAVDELPKFYCLVIPRGKNGGPMMLVSAPKVG